MEYSVMSGNLRNITAVVIVAVTVCLSLLRPASHAQEPPKDSNQLDLADYFRLIKYYVEPVPVTTDPKTGFIVAGKNDNSRIRGLSELNGRSIVELEKDMRPGATSEVGSDKGFPGLDEKLLDVLAADNTYVVDELGLTHQQLPKHLYAMGHR